MYDKILVPVDGSDASNLGLDEAVKLAKRLGSRLKVIHVVNELFLAGTDQMYYDFGALVDSARENGKKVLEEAQARIKAQGAEAEAELIECVSARAADIIVNHAQQWGADLLVLGTHGRRGLRRLALGSDAEMVLRASPIPVLLVRAKTAEGAGKPKS